MTHDEQSRRWTRSAANSWFSWGRVRKSLILEASATTSRAVFAINRVLFAMSSVLAPGRPAAFSSLSNSLKEKEKVHKEGQEIACKGMPRVKAVLPSVTRAAYFLGHEFHESEMPYSWQLMVCDFLLDQIVTSHTDAHHESTCCAACGLPFDNCN